MRIPVPLGRVLRHWGYAQDAWRYWQMLNNGLGQNPVLGRMLQLSGGLVVDNCGPGGGPSVTNQAWPNCGPEFVIGPPWVQTPGLKVWVWGRWVGRVNQFSPNSRYKPGFAYVPDSLAQQPFRVGYSALPAPGVQPGLGVGQGPHWNTPGVPMVPRPMPRSLSPHQRDAPGLRETGNGRVWSHDPGFQPDGRPRPRPRPDDRPDRPPPPGEKEKKVRIPSALGVALKAAYTATETADLIDALFDALPKHIRQAVPRSGRTRKGARVGDGVPYATPHDKALHLWRNMRHVDAPEAVKNIIVNHVTDEIIGRSSAQVDRHARRYLGGARFVGG